MCICSCLSLYSRFIARKVFNLDDNRQTPAHTLNDGKDYVPTNKWVLFGHHFARLLERTLVGMDFSGTNGVFTRNHLDYCWGSCCGAVQDFVILFASMRRNGKSLGEMIKDEIGPVYRTNCNDRYFRNYDYFISSISVGRSKGTNRKSLGNVYDSKERFLSLF